MGDTLRRIEPPPARSYVCVLDVPMGVNNERCVLVNAAGAHYGFRCWSDVDYDRPGGPEVQVVSEKDWWANALTGARPERVEWWPATHCFVG